MATSRSRAPGERLRSRLNWLILSVLKGHGFARMHQSLYTGPADRLRSALEDLELTGVLPLLRWGTITVFSP